MVIPLIGITLYLFMRNNYVYEFKKKLIEESYNILHKHLWSFDILHTTDEEFQNHIDENDKLRKISDSISSISYNKMLFSIKPLTSKYWLDKEQLEFLSRNYV